ncbi:MAG: hypothetical protein ACJ76V_11600 [Thermoleophilaceae bacterium]
MSVLAEIVAAVDPTLAAYAVPEPGPGRFEDTPLDHDRAFVLEAVHEAYLMHYGEPRAFAGMDSDLRLLAGDALYALGLARLAELGDLEAVRELADLIALCAWAHADERADVVEELWRASARALSPQGGPGARAAVRERLVTGATGPGQTL